MAHLLVTGGAGYVGSHALRALLEAGHSAVVVDDLSTGRPELVRGAPLVRCRIEEGPELPLVLREQGPFDGVLHFAARSIVSESTAHPLDYYASNVAATLALVRAALDQGVRAFVFSSSAAVYGQPTRHPIPESAPLAPTHAYGASKAMVERILEDAGRAHGLRWMALRYFNAAGAHPDGDLGECHDPETHLIPSALEAVAGLRPELSLFGTDYPTPDGTCIRDYVHVVDLAAAHVRAVEALLGEHPGGAYNLGTGRGHSNREVLDSVERVTGRAVPLRESARRPGDPPVLVADPSRFERELAFRPRLPELDDMVASAWAWLRRFRGL